MTVHDCSNVMHVPLLLKTQGLCDFLQKRLALPQRTPAEDFFARWTAIAHQYRPPHVLYPVGWMSFPASPSGWP